MTQEYIPQVGDLVRLGAPQYVDPVFYDLDPVFYVVLKVTPLWITVQNTDNKGVNTWPSGILANNAGLHLVSRAHGTGA